MTERVLVAYGSKHGSTAELAAWLGDALAAEGLRVDVRPAHEVKRLSADDGAVVLGGALYADRWPRSARRFARRHARALRDRPVWLFSSGPLDSSATEHEIPPTKTVAAIMGRVGARGHKTFGGSLSPDVNGWLAKKVAAKRSGDFRDRDQVVAWAHEIAAALTPSSAAT